jgi:hypothetical protein
MARPRNNEAPDLSKRVNLTVGVIERLTCRTDQKHRPSYATQRSWLEGQGHQHRRQIFVFEAKLDRQTIRRTIGDVKTWTIDQARAEARRLAVTLDNGDDPRELARQREAERAKQKAAAETRNHGSRSLDDLHRGAQSAMGRTPSQRSPTVEQSRWRHSIARHPRQRHYPTRPFV